MVGGNTAVLSTVLRLAVDDLHRDDAVTVRHRVLVLAQLLTALIPFYLGVEEKVTDITLMAFVVYATISGIVIFDSLF